MTKALVEKLVEIILASHATNSEKQEILDVLKNYTNSIYDECAKILKG